jgi:hypothetical protein
MENFAGAPQMLGLRAIVPIRLAETGQSFRQKLNQEKSGIIQKRGCIHTVSNP